MSRQRRIWTDEEILDAFVANPLDQLATLAIAHQHAPRLREFAQVVIAHEGCEMLGMIDTAVVDGVKKAIASLTEKPSDWPLSRWLDHCVEIRAQKLRALPTL